ncbi:hypothetical protein WG901_22175 [Novosphingobium sp. PS1R-30]|uniref:Uncharacterized protein n=1 Tax=Novosphingobium anseongense TaxID=3133436 RepID=A0ABU8S278_9SPHN
MTIRTKISSAKFAAPFKVQGHEEIMPAGIYRVDIDEEAIEAIDRTIYRRMETMLPVETVGRIVHRRIEPVDLEALLKDREAVLHTALLRSEPSIYESDAKILGKTRSRFWSLSALQTIGCWAHTVLAGGRRSEL